MTNGTGFHFPSPVLVPFASRNDSDETYLGARRTTRQLFYDRFGVHFANGFIHAPITQLRSVHYEMEELFGAEHRRTVANRFRGVDDVVFVSILHHFLAYTSGRSIPSRLGYRYINLGKKTNERQLTRLLATRDIDALCLNDNQVEGVEPVTDELLDAFMKAYFAIPSTAEL
jgi:hypothetical protein